MIVENQSQITDAVLGEVQRIADPRLREIVTAAVRHLHDFAREVKLTEDEFRQACAFNDLATFASRAFCSFAVDARMRVNSSKSSFTSAKIPAGSSWKCR